MSSSNITKDNIFFSHPFFFFLIFTTDYNVENLRKHSFSQLQKATRYTCLKFLPLIFVFAVCEEIMYIPINVGTFIPCSQACYLKSICFLFYTHTNSAILTKLLISILFKI